MQMKFAAVHGDRCFTKPIIHVWCKKTLGWQKFRSDTQVQSVVGR